MYPIKFEPAFELLNCVVAAGAAAFGSCIGASMMDSPTHPYFNMMKFLSVTTLGIVIAGVSSTLPAFSATTGVAVSVGAAFLYKIGEMLVNHTKEFSQAPGICAVVLGATTAQAGLAYTAASVVLHAAPITSLLGGSDAARFSGLCATICTLAASNALYIGALARISSHWMYSAYYAILGAAIGGAVGAAAGAYICSASYIVTAAAVAGASCPFVFNFFSCE
jgi:hypothetical protein